MTTLTAAEVVAMLRRAMDAEDPDEWIADAIALMARLDPDPASGKDGAA